MAKELHMKRRIRISRNVKKGFASAFNLKPEKNWPSAGNYNIEDAKAIYSDWVQVGKDLRIAQSLL